MGCVDQCGNRSWPMVLSFYGVWLYGFRFYGSTVYGVMVYSFMIVWFYEFMVL